MVNDARKRFRPDTAPMLAGTSGTFNETTTEAGLSSNRCCKSLRPVPSNISREENNDHRACCRLAAHNRCRYPLALMMPANRSPAPHPGLDSSRSDWESSAHQAPHLSGFIPPVRASATPWLLVYLRTACTINRASATRSTAGEPHSARGQAIRACSASLPDLSNYVPTHARCT